MLTLPLLLAWTSQSSVPPLDLKNAFPFVIPWDDALKGTATDVSFLNVRPAGKNGRIVVKNGHFAEEKTGRRVRFFATNLGAEAAFPDKDEADRIAAHMAKLGINLVRLHHLNNGWAVESGGTVWKKGRTYIEMDPAQLDKLDYFVAALKKQGIYVNVNLQTSREYVPELGLPESVRQIPSFQKKVDKFYERMIVLQQEYARSLLDRRNPYTGLKYADDPAVAKVEINNENSLVGWPGESAGARLNGLPEPFVSDLRAKWNAWLKRTYGTDTALRAAWSAEGGALGRSVVTAAKPWSHENQSNGDVRFETTPAASSDHADGFKATIRSNPGPNWHVQAHVGGLDLTNNQVYTATFRARADRSMTLGVDARLDQPDWRNVGLGGSVDLTPEWKEYALAFRVVGTEPNHARIGFVLGDVRGTVEIQELRVRPGGMIQGLPEGESVEAGTVGIPTASLSPRFRDWARFVAETEQAFSERMRKFLREDLGFRRTNIIDTQISWGGLTSLSRERQMEYADNHAYWNHPVFLGSDWDPKNYRVERRALVNGLPGDAGTLAGLALFRVMGKPYSVSEYNHPAPSDYQVEMMPLIATFAAFQDWDAIYTFSWDATGKRVRNDRYEGYFDVARNPAKSAFFPASALIFRLGLVPPAPTARTLVAPERPWEPAFTPGEGWTQAGRKPDPLRERLGVRWRPEAKAPAIEGGAPGGGALRVAGKEGARVYVADSPQSLALTGFLGGTTHATGAGTVTFGALPTGFGSLMLSPLDGKTLRTSGRLLLTLGSRVENPGMAWNATRDSVSDQWGQGPVVAERVPCRLALKVDGPRRVFALDPRGRRAKKIPATYRSGVLSFDTAGAASMWVEVVK